MNVKYKGRIYEAIATGSFGLDDLVMINSIVGFVDFKNDVSSKKNILLNMNSTLSKRGPDEDGYYINKNVALGHKRLIVIDPERWKTTNDKKYRK